MTIEQAAQKAREAEVAQRNMTGPELLADALAKIADTQAELGRLSGLSQNALRSLKRGGKPTAAQRAAICWAIFTRWS